MYLGYIYESLKEYNISTAYFRKASDLKLSPKQKKTVLLKLIIYFNYMHAWNYVVHYSNQYLILDPGNVEVEKILSKGRGNRGSDQIASVNLQYQDREKSNKQDKTKITETESKPSTKDPKNEKAKESKKVSNEETELWDLALRSIEKGEYTNAFSFLSKLIESFPDNKDYLYKAGIVKMRLKEYDKAVDYFDLALKNTNEKNETMYYYLYLNKGIALSKLEKFEQALDVLKKSYSYNRSFLPILIIIRLKYD
jgi:tetratricopeptide (TPR) repeat protein